MARRTIQTRWLLALATLEFAWCATSRRGARAALAIEASRRPEDVWVAFLDDDDLWAPDKLDRQLHALQDTRREWAYTGDIVVDGEFRILSGAPPPSPEEVIESLRRYNSVPAGASNVIVSSRLLSHVGPFDTEAETNCRLGHVASARPLRSAGVGLQPFGGELHSRGKHVQGHDDLVPGIGRAGSSSPNTSGSGQALPVGGVGRPGRRADDGTRFAIMAGRSLRVICGRSAAPRSLCFAPSAQAATREQKRRRLDRRGSRWLDDLR